MPTTRPPAPDSVHEDAFKVFVDVLRNDPMLSARNVRWSYWSNDRDDIGPRSPTEADCPFIRLFPLSGGQAQRLGSDGTTIDYAVPLTIQIQTMVASTHRAEAFGLSTMILGALFPTDPVTRRAVDDRFRNVGVVDVVLRQPILPSSPGDFYSNVIMSQGEIALEQILRL